MTFLRPGTLEWREVPDLRLQEPGEALVHPIAVATCGLDGATIRGEALLCHTVKLVLTRD